MKWRRSGQVRGVKRLWRDCGFSCLNGKARGERLLRASVGMRWRHGQGAMRNRRKCAGIAMALEKMFLCAPAPGADEIVVERAACSRAEHRDHAGGPFLRHFGSQLYGNPIDDSRHDSLDRLLFDEVAP